MSDPFAERYQYSTASLINRLERTNPDHIASLLGLEFRDNDEGEEVKRQLIQALNEFSSRQARQWLENSIPGNSP